MLKQLHPFPFDDAIVFTEKGHTYKFKSNPSIETISTTTLIEKYHAKFDAGGHIARAVVGKINRVHGVWKSNGGKIRNIDEWKDDYPTYIPFQLWDAMYTFENEGVAFEDALAPFFKDARFFRALECFEPHVRQAFEAWEQAGRPPALYREYMGQSYLQCLRFPPFVYAEDVGNMWTEQGTLLHKDIEDYLEAAAAYNTTLDHLTVDLGVSNPRPEWKYFLQLMNDIQHNYKVLRTEMNVGIESLGLCGRLDALLLNLKTGMYALVDWKCTKQELIPVVKKRKRTIKYMDEPWDNLEDNSFNHYMIQQNLYIQQFYHAMRRHGAENEIIPIAESFIAQLHRNQSTYVWISVPVFQEGEDNFRRLVIMLNNLSNEKYKKSFNWLNT